MDNQEKLTRLDTPDKIKDEDKRSKKHSKEN
jgi:hypothetical protein